MSKEELALFEIQNYFNSFDKRKNYEELQRATKRIYEDLSRVEIVNKYEMRKNSLDLMFIIDCTGSMASWIQACKNEIKSITQFVITQFGI